MKTKSLKSASPLLLIATVLLLSPFQSRANTVALDFIPSGETQSFNAIAGWDFNLNTNVFVTDLGIWDSNNTQFFGTPGDGLVQSHTISIWTSTGTLVTSAIVPAGGGTLVDGFRYISIAPTFLIAGNYVIGAHYQDGTDRSGFASMASNITTASELTYGQGRFSAGNSGNIFPSQTIQNNGDFGPNFQFIAPPTNGVPETGGTFLLLGAALVPLAVGRFLRRPRCGA